MYTLLIKKGARQLRKTVIRRIIIFLSREGWTTVTIRWWGMSCYKFGYYNKKNRVQ
jgi:hypothetical protein